MINHYFRHFSITVLLAVTISLAAPNAMAGLGTGTIPPIPVLGETIDLKLVGSAGSAPHTMVSIRVFESGLNPLAPLDYFGPASNPCTTDPTMPDSDGVLKAWDLMHGEVVAQFNIAAPTDVLSITFGTGSDIETVTYNALELVADNIADAGIGDYSWRQTAASPTPGLADDNTNILTTSPDFYTFIDCGTELGANPAFFDDHNFGTQEENDVDDDGVPDIEDNCPDDANSGQEDSDGNGIGDACQDLDGDMVLDVIDNCPFIPNPLQEDVLPEEGGNGIGDACESTEPLLVDATFPPGDTIEIELPDLEDPDTETITLSLELPENVGGDVTIEITDAGDTEANFSFLGSIIDLTAPCTDIDVCGISFTFTEQLLIDQGLTLAEVRIFHDGEITEENPEGMENGSFEDTEAIETTVVPDTPPGPFTATGFPSSTSKFSVGGIKALALGALAGGTGGSRGGAPPTLENISFDGAKIVNEDGTIGFGGLIIDEISAVNDFPTQTFEIGTTFELHFPFFEDNGAGAVEHVAIYFLNDGGDTVYDSDLYVSIDRYLPLEAYDSNGYISNYTVNLVEQSSELVDVVFGFTFTQPLGPSDIIVRAWDLDKRTIDYRFNQFLQVIDADSSELIGSTDLTSESTSNDDSIIDSSTIVKYDLQSLNTINDSAEDSENNPIEIPLWIKFNANWWSQEKIGDDDFVAGIQYLVENEIIRIPELDREPYEGVNEIPPWIKSNAEWWADDIVSDEEFVSSIHWLIKEGVIKV